MLYEDVRDGIVGAVGVEEVAKLRDSTADLIRWVSSGRCGISELSYDPDIRPDEVVHGPDWLPDDWPRKRVIMDQGRGPDLGSLEGWNGGWSDRSEGESEVFEEFESVPSGHIPHTCGLRDGEQWAAGNPGAEVSIADEADVWPTGIADLAFTEGVASRCGSTSLSYFTVVESTLEMCTSAGPQPITTVSDLLCEPWYKHHRQDWLTRSNIARERLR